MKLTFRWFGVKDPVPLEHIYQIPAVRSITSQVNAKAVGEVIDEKVILDSVRIVQEAGMSYDVFESLPVHPSILLGTGERDAYIEKYKENVILLGSAGIKVIVYNFRPIFRWARTEIDKVLEDGSTVSVYNQDDEDKIDPFSNDSQTSLWHQKNSKYIYERQLTTDLVLDGYYIEPTTEILRDLRKQYQAIGKDGLWENLSYFLNEIIPVAEMVDVRMGAHPDDPPWDLFGVPRLLTSEKAIDRLLSLYDSKYNGFVFCSGTMGSDTTIDVPKLAAKYVKQDRIPFAHIRNVLSVPGEVQESAHYSECGSIDMVELLSAFYENGYQGYIRPDHGRMIWGEQGTPGNGIFDRALGVQYILGIWETLSKKSSVK